MQIRTRTREERMHKRIRSILKNRKGFSVIEFVVVAGLVVLVGVATLVVLLQFRAQADLDSATEGIRGALGISRSRTLGSENASTYGVYFESATYTIFTGRVYVPGAPSNEPQQIPTGIEIFNVQLSTSTPSVVFDRLTGNTSTTGTIGLRRIGDVSPSRTIVVESSGNVSLAAASVAQLGTRVTDTRHLHFDLGWTIQNAETLRLRFSDPPNPDVVNDIAMASYFDAPKSMFLWEGDTSVYGANQHIKVHTHSLDSLNTMLSVHRDRRNNSKALTLSIIDGIEKQIASYTASGTSTVEIYGGTMSQQ